ncbi:MAG: fasciclin domain-containing protein [Flavobacteriaceae bacterium]|nr:fasciclin domain-containing protein [Flavobacteriaceae bacterium]
MKQVRLFFSVLFFALLIISCKSDSKETNGEATSTETNDNSTSTVPKEAEQVVNSVFRKAMTTPELKTFVSATISAGLTDELMKNEGPFTLLAPSNDAFEQVPKEKMDVLLNPKNLPDLKRLLENHIVAENLSSAAILQAIKQNGTAEIKTMGGATLTAFMQDNDLVLKDASDNIAYIGKSDINGSNGTVHVIGKVLSLD